MILDVVFKGMEEYNDTVREEFLFYQGMRELEEERYSGVK